MHSVNHVQDHRTHKSSNLGKRKHKTKNTKNHSNTNSIHMTASTPELSVASDVTFCSAAVQNIKMGCSVTHMMVIHMIKSGNF